MAHRANIDRIRSWQGIARVTDQQSFDALRLKSIAEVKFAYDSKQQASRWNWHNVVVEPQSDLLENISGMKKDSQFMRFGWYSQKMRPRGMIYSEDSRDGQLGNLSYDFDPMWYYCVHGTTYETRLLPFYEFTVNKTKGFVPWKLTFEGDLLIYESNDGGNINRYELDLAKDGMLARFMVDSIVVREEYEHNWTKVKDIWVPSKFTYRHFANKALDRERTVEFQSNELNQDAPALDFGPKSLGMKSGEVVFDARNNQRLRIQENGDLVPVSNSPSAAPPPAAPKPKWRRWLFGVLNGLVALGIIVLVLRRYIFKAPKSAS
jgi:hypothetical protein